MAKSSQLSKKNFEKVLLHHNLGTVDKFRILEGGYGSPVVLINDTYVIKSNEGEQAEHAERITREALAFSLLQKHSLPSPNLIAYSTDKHVVPFYYLIVSFLQGDTLTNSYESQVIEVRKKVAYDLGNILKEIHAIQKDEIHQNLSYFIYTDWKKRAIAEFDAGYNSFQSHTNQLSNDQKHGIVKIQEDFDHMIEASDIPEAFLHYDFHADHIFMSGDKITGVIDFEWARFGDPLWDFQKMLIGFSVGDSFQTKDFLRGYGMNTFSEKELIRLKFYAIIQGIWQVDNAKHGKYGYPESAIEKGYQLIDKTIHLAYV